METARKVLFWILLQTISLSVQREIRYSRHNDVLEEDEEPLLVPYNALEAFYYASYGDTDPIMRQFGRLGDSTEDNTCETIRAVPDDLRHSRFMRPRGLNAFYQKYTEAYGIPVVGSRSVSDAAMRRACYVLRFLLADRPDLRQQYYKAYGRVAVLATGNVMTDIPEYSTFLPEIYDKATRGLGGISIAPVSTGAEENLLCFQNDTYLAEDVMLREIALGIFQLAAKELMPELSTELDALYEHAMASSKWTHTYSAYSKEAYFGEGVQSFFGGNGYAYPSDGYHGNINSRAKLMTYDPELFLFIQKIFPCANNYIKRCSSRGYESYQTLRMNCMPGTWHSFLKK